MVLMNDAPHNRLAQYPPFRALLTMVVTCGILLFPNHIAAQNKVAGELQKLATRFKKSPTKRASLYQPLITFCQAYAGTPEACQATVLLTHCPSPLDRLQLKDSDKFNQIKTYPKELVAYFKNHRRAASHVAFSPDGRLLATSGWDNTIHVRKLDTQTFKTWKTLKGSPSGLVFSPKGRFLATGTLGTQVIFWQIEKKTLTAKHSVSGHDGRPFAVAFSPNGKLFASGSTGPLLRVWKVTSGEPEAWAVFSDEDEPTIGIRTLSFSADSKLLAATAFAGKKTLRIWDFGGAYTKEVAFPSVQERLARFSPDGKLLMTAGRDGTITLWTRKGNKFKKKAIWQDHRRTGLFNDIKAAFSPSGHRLVTADTRQRKVILWNPRTGKKLREWTFPARVNGLAFAPDGRHLATANQDGSVFVLRLKK